MTDPSCLTIINEDLTKEKMILPTEPPSYLDLKFLQNDELDEPVEHKIQNGRVLPLAASPVILSRLVGGNVISNGADVKEIIELEMQIDHPCHKWTPGDTIGIIPKNSIQDVDELLKRLGVFDKADMCVKIDINKNTKKKNVSVPKHLPHISTLRHIFETCVDIRCVPKKLLIRVLASHSSEHREKLRLEQLCSRQGTEEYRLLVVESGVTLLTLLKMFPSCCPPVANLLELLPSLAPRPYSLACSDLPLRVVFSTVPGGVCTTWLRTQLDAFQALEERLSALSLADQQSSGIQIPLYFRKSSNFMMPLYHTKPLILICAGTGIAPFLGFLQKRESEMRSTTSDHLGEIWLFYGCRYSSRDYIYRSLLQTYLDNRSLSRLFVTFSRESKKDEDPKYVQDNIKLYGNEFVAYLIDKDGTLFVCGDANNMVSAVEETIFRVLQKERGMSEEAAQTCLKQLKASGRYVQDVWR